MEPSQLRYAILHLLDQREASGYYIDDIDIATALGEELAKVQRQMLILGDQRLIDLIKAFGPRYSAVLTPKGMQALEAEGRTSLPPAPSVTVHIHDNSGVVNTGSVGSIAIDVTNVEHEDS